jgi:hypothetical protein
MITAAAPGILAAGILVPADIDGFAAVVAGAALVEAADDIADEVAAADVAVVAPPAALELAVVVPPEDPQAVSAPSASAATDTASTPRRSSGDGPAGVTRVDGADGVDDPDGVSIRGDAIRRAVSTRTS